MENISKELKEYLIWRCKTCWHNKYLKSSWYINQWISNVTFEQIYYFINHEMPNMIKNNLYKI